MTGTVLIVDDEENARYNLSSFLTSRGYETISVASLAEARQQIKRNTADIVLLDVSLTDGYGPVLLEETAHIPNRPPIILITAYGDIEMAVDAMKNGAFDFLQKPIQLTNLETSVRRAMEQVAMRRELAHLREARTAGQSLVAQSPKMKQILSHAQRAAAVSASVLITGETGTGKEILANYIHKVGPRANKQFMGISCPAIPSTVMESELFGYEPGAFTGAEKKKAGLMEIADGGILFLDEISSMPMDMQVKLLRALEERAFRRVGGTNLIKVDVQVIAASNRDLMTLILDGKFREDLYYRLQVVTLMIPPLRERLEDIPDLVGLFIRQNNQHMGMNIEGISPKAMDAIMHYQWPGNIRQLRNVIERAMLFCDDEILDLCHLPPEVYE